MIKAISALRLAVDDVDRSLAFYKKLGFTEIPGAGPSREVRSNWFRIRFERRGRSRGNAGLRICISVDDVDGFEAELKKQRISSTRESAGKSTELVVEDPDGYSLLFFATTGKAQSGAAAHREKG